MIIHDASLLRTRQSQIRRMIDPLIAPGGRFSIQQIGASRDVYVLAAVRNNETNLANLSPEQPQLRTKLGRIFVNYHEMWRPQPANGDYVLNRVYMHFHAIYQLKSKQILSLHCDPGVSQGQFQFEYGRGPHLHLEGATPDIARAHVSLCVTDTAKGGATLKDLMTGFHASVKMIIEEVFPCWERAGLA
jgi:hypothetical protein